MSLSVDHDPLLDRLVARLEREHGCQVVILYGSRARGDAAADSDYDVVGFSERAAATSDEPGGRLTGLWDGALLDVFVYPVERLDTPGPQLMHIRGGRVLRDVDGRDGNGRGAAFLARLDAVFAAGPEPLSADEIAARRNWAWKMLDRCARGDVEGDFRRVWLLTMLLENYFLLRGRWYLGCKAAIAELAATQPDVHAVLRRALTPGASLAEVEALVVAVNGPRG